MGKIDYKESVRGVKVETLSWADVPGKSGSKLFDNCFEIHLFLLFCATTAHCNLLIAGSAAPNLDTKELDARVQEALDVEDPDILTDLREMNGSKQDKYAVFWKHMKGFLEDQPAVHECRQTTITYMATAFSTHDLVEEVKKLCPPDTPIPSTKWVRFQFHPRHPSSKAAKMYTERFNLRMMVQSRQLRLTHEDKHYCSAYFR